MRLLTLAIVGLLSSCSQQEVGCVRTDYQQVTLPARSGEIVLHWDLDQQTPEGFYGDTVCAPALGDVPVKCFVRLNITPTFNDSCSLAKLGHEVNHAMGAQHEKGS